MKDILYHGSDEKHEFTGKRGHIADGSFISENPEVAREYGKYVYKVKLKSNKIFDPLEKENLDALFDQFEELYDNYSGEYITKEEFYTSSDTWDPIENTEGVVRWIKSKGYDGVEILEGGRVNYMMFYPNEDIEIIGLLSESRIHNFKSFNINEGLGISKDLSRLADKITSCLLTCKYFTLKDNIRGIDFEMDIYLNSTQKDYGTFRINANTHRYEMYLKTINKGTIIHELKHLENAILHSTKREKKGKGFHGHTNHDCLNTANHHLSDQFKHIFKKIDPFTNDGKEILQFIIYLSNPNEFESYYNQIYFELTKLVNKKGDVSNKKIIDELLQKQDIYKIYKQFYKDPFDIRIFFRNKQDLNFYLEEIYRNIETLKTKSTIFNYSTWEKVKATIKSVFNFSRKGTLNEYNKNIKEFNKLINYGIQKNYKRFGRLYTLFT